MTRSVSSDTADRAEWERLRQRWRQQEAQAAAPQQQQQVVLPPAAMSVAAQRERELAQVFIQFLSSPDYNLAPAQSFKHCPPVQYEPSEAQLRGGELMYHQLINALAYMRFFDSPSSLSASDVDTAQLIWTAMSDRRDGYVYWDSFLAVLRFLFEPLRSSDDDMESTASGASGRSSKNAGVRRKLAAWHRRGAAGTGSDAGGGARQRGRAQCSPVAPRRRSASAGAAWGRGARDATVVMDHTHPVQGAADTPDVRSGGAWRGTPVSTAPNVLNVDTDGARIAHAHPPTAEGSGGRFRTPPPGRGAAGGAGAPDSSPPPMPAGVAPAPRVLFVDRDGPLLSGRPARGARLEWPRHGAAHAHPPQVCHRPVGHRPAPPPPAQGEREAPSPPRQLTQPQPAAPRDGGWQHYSGPRAQHQPPRQRQAEQQQQQQQPPPRAVTPEAEGWQRRTGTEPAQHQPPRAQQQQQQQQPPPQPQQQQQPPPQTQQQLLQPQQQPQPQLQQQQQQPQLLLQQPQQYPPPSRAPAERLPEPHSPSSPARGARGPEDSWYPKVSPSPPSAPKGPAESKRSIKLPAAPGLGEWQLRSASPDPAPPAADPAPPAAPLVKEAPQQLEPRPVVQEPPAPPTMIDLPPVGTPEHAPAPLAPASPSSPSAAPAPAAFSGAVPSGGVPQTVPPLLSSGHPRRPSAASYSFETGSTRSSRGAIQVGLPQSPAPSAPAVRPGGAASRRSLSASATSYGGARAAPPPHPSPSVSRRASPVPDRAHEPPSQSPLRVSAAPSPAPGASPSLAGPAVEPPDPDLGGGIEAPSPRNGSPANHPRRAPTLAARREERRAQRPPAPAAAALQQKWDTLQAAFAPADARQGAPPARPLTPSGSSVRGGLAGATFSEAGERQNVAAMTQRHALATSPALRRTRSQWTSPGRSGGQRSASVSIARDRDRSPPPPPPELVITRAAGEKLGMTFEDHTLLSAVRPGLAAERCGARQFVGHRVTHANGEAVATLDAVRAACRRSSRIVLRFATPGASPSRVALRNT